MDRQDIKLVDDDVLQGLEELFNPELGDHPGTHIEELIPKNDIKLHVHWSHGSSFDHGCGNIKEIMFILADNSDQTSVNDELELKCFIVKCNVCNRVWSWGPSRKTYLHRDLFDPSKLHRLRPKTL